MKQRIIPELILHNGEDKWEVINDKPFIIKPLAMSPHMSTYLDYNTHYTLELRHCSSYEVWEIPPEQMKRDSSQVLLYLWDEGDVGIEIDF